MRKGRALFTTLALAASLALPAGAAEPDRGRALYELRCLGCHGESVHARTKRTARNFGEVRSWVARWNATLALRWNDEEINEVSVYLNTSYYRYPCPPTVCKVVSLAPAPAPARR